jgi:YfiH family protein
MNFIELFQHIPNVKAITSTVGFNACDYAGANLNQVNADRFQLAKFFNVSTNNLFIPRQTHSTNVATPGDNLNNIDAIVSNKPNQVIAINTADCLPLLLVDPSAGIIAAAHCGWRGTVAGIVENTLQKMISIGANPKNIVAAMGPCIGVECFEVGNEVAEQFPEESIIRSYDKPHVDLAKAVSLQLLSLGLNKQNITTPFACSMCDNRFHSVRREGRSLPFRTLTAISLIPTD